MKGLTQGRCWGSGDVGGTLCGWRDPPARPWGQAIPWEGSRVLLQAERPSHHRSVTAAQASWGWGCSSNEAGIARGMDLGLQPRWIRDCDPDGSGIETQMSPGLQTKWVWDCNPDGSGVTSQTGPELQPRWVQDCNQMGLGLQPG